MKITIEEIQNKFEKLPEDLKWAILESDVDNKIKAIGDEQGLNVRQLSILSFQVHSAMVGFISIEKLDEIIKSNLGADEEKINIVISNINERIFKDIRDKLMKLYKRGNEVEDESLKQEPLAENKEEIKIIKEEEKKVEKIENTENDNKKKEFLSSITSQKLTSSISSPIIKTEYSLNNISKENTKKETTKVDPYRMPVE